jgi:hypothetical protein
LPPWCPQCGGDLKPKAAPALVGAANGKTWPAAPSEDTAVIRAEDLPGRELPVPLDVNPPTSLGELDTPQEAYAGNPWRRLVAWIVSIVCFGLVAAIGYGVLNQPDQTPTAGIGLMVVFAAGAFAALFMALTLGERSYFVYREALVEKRGKQIQVIPWNHIREVTETIHTTWTKYRVLARGGVDITLTADIRNHRALGRTIEAKLVENLLPAVLAQLEAGETIRFGPVGVNRDGVFVEEIHSPWAQTTMNISLRMDRLQDPTDSKLMHLHVYTAARTRSFQVELSRVPNLCLLLELMRRNAPHGLPPGMLEAS